MPVVQDPAELEFAVLDRAIDPAPAILRQVRIHHEGLTVWFQVISASHVVRLEVAGRLWFCETLSCRAPSQNQYLHRHSFADLADHRVRIGGYHAEIMVGCDEPPARDDAQSCLEVTFPEVDGGTPLTRIQWSAQPGRLSWTTLHTYPNSDRASVVVSRSSIAISDLERSEMMLAPPVLDEPTLLPQALRG